MENNTNNSQEGQGNVVVAPPNTITPPVENRPVAPKATVEAPAATAGKEKEMVPVPKDVLERLLNRVDDLEAAADIGRLSRVQGLRSQGKLVKTAKLSVYNGKVVLGWFTVKDDVYTDEKGVIHEDQQVKLILDDKDEEGNKVVVESEPVSYRTFSRVITKITGEVIKESSDSEGRKTVTIKLDDGREYELSVVFIN